MADPEWAEFEQINVKTLVRPRDDFVFRFGQDFEAGMRSKVGDIVYNPTDGLVYRCIKETDSVAPDYTDSIANTYWTWIAGSISEEVAGRGWWEVFPDGTLRQRGKFSSSLAIATSFLGGYRSAAITVDFPVEFLDTNIVLILAPGALNSLSVVAVSISASQFQAVFTAVTSQGVSSRNGAWIAIGKRKI